MSIVHSSAYRLGSRETGSWHLHYTLRVPLLLALLLACGTDPEPVTCAEGELLDGDACVPEACGTGTWGELETDGDTIYVDGSAEDGGDGSRDRPFTVIQEGLDTQDGDGMVAVAAGTYLENLQMNSDHSGVHLAGRCRELVVIDASEGDEEDYAEGCGIYLDGSLTTTWAVSGVTVTRAPWFGIYQYKGVLTLNRNSVADNQFRGLACEYGSLDATDCLVQGNHEAGVTVGGSAVTLTRLQVLDTQPNADDGFGRGLNVAEGSTVEATDCLVQGNHEVGLVISDSTVTLERIEVLDTLPNGSEEGGRGIAVNDSTLVVTPDCRSTPINATAIA
ncbi:MAG: right-handed parallel beta-helix repeat-containing protein [Myxococcota bacterium]|nr:right-handed parallel beta-helix repeat-containing protein [Myxococcota bacterium]